MFRLTWNRALLCATILAPVPAIAQESVTDRERIDAEANTIIVTARKREETLLEAPLAVSVFGEDELENAGFTDITEITQASPGVFVEPYSTSFSRINTSPRFRGVVLNAGDRLQQTASVFIDGIFTSDGSSTFGVNELARVEIIKGPQSALFGRNTFSGAINYVTKDPSDELRADVELLAATRDEYRIAASVEGPLADWLGFRISGSYDDQNGHYDNIADPGATLGDQRQWTMAGTLMFEPSPDLSLKLRGSYQKIDDGPAAAVSYYGIDFHNFGGFLRNADGTVQRDDSVIPRPFGSAAAALRTETIYSGPLRGDIPASEIGLNTGDTYLDLWRTIGDDPRYAASGAATFKYNPLNAGFGLELDNLRFSAVGSADLSDTFSLSLLAGYGEEQFGYFGDFDLTPDASFGSYSAREIDDLTIEGRVNGKFLNDRLIVSAGASYVKVDIREANGLADFRFPNPSGISFFSAIFGPTTTSGAETRGVFGSIDYEFNDLLSVTLEGRYQEDEIYEDSVNIRSLEPISPATIDSFLPRATVRLTPSDLSMLYFTYGKGNLPGGYNPQVGELTTTQLAEFAQLAPGIGVTFGEEKLENFELGWKQAQRDGIWAFNAAAFYMKRSDEVFRGIVSIADPSQISGARTVAYTGNGATTNIYGIEVDATLNPVENLTLQGSFAYVDAKIASFPADGGTGDFGDVFGTAADVAGQQAIRFPPITLSLGGTLTQPIGEFAGMDQFFLRGDVFHNGGFYISNTNLDKVPPSTVVNLRAGFQGDDSRIEFFVTNLFENDVPSSAYNFADTSFAVRNQPGGLFDFTREGASLGLRDKRQFGVRLKHTFR